MLITRGEIIDMEVIYESKAEIVKGTSKSGNTYYGLMVALTNEYKSFIILQNADRELVKQMELSLSQSKKDE